MTEQEEFEFRLRLEQEQGSSKPQPSAGYRRGRDLPGALQGLASVMQGPTFGFADEIGGLFGGAKSALSGGTFGQGYQDTRDMLRGAADSQQEQNPIPTAILRAVASAPTFLLNPFGRVATSGALPGRIGNAALTGGTFGAVSGAGSSTAESVGGVAADAGIGAALGAGTSAAALPLGAAVNAVGRNVGARFSDGMASRYAKEKVAEALTRDARGTVAQSGLTSPLQQSLARFDKLGPEARVVDAGGQNTKQLLDTLTILPGRAKEASETAIRTRQAGRADRMIGAAERSLGTNGDRAAQVVDDLVRMREEAARPLYGQLHRMEVGADSELSSILSAAEKLGAGKVARDIATASRVPYSLSEDAWNASGGRLAMRDLDHMKQGLDTLIAKQTDPAGKVSPLGFRLQGLRQDLLTKLDDATGGFYAQARNAYAGPSALVDATNRGRRFMVADDAATRKALDGLSESEREAFRLGAFEALRSKLGTPGGQTEVLGMWKNKTLREKLQAIFPDERAFREFASETAKEARLKGIESVGRGSQTAGRQMALGDLDVSAISDIGGMAGGAANGNLPGFLLSTANAWNRVKTPEPVRDAMSSLLLQGGPAGRGGLLDLEQTMMNVNAARSGRAAAVGVGGGLLAPGLLSYVH